MHRLALAAGFTLAVATSFASAADLSSSVAARTDRCASAARGPFRPAAELTAIVEQLGYRPEQVGTDAGCYAVRASDRRGRQFDLRFEGANLRMVSRYFARTAADVVAQR